MIALYILKIDTQHQREIMDQLDKAQRIRDQGVMDTLKRVQSSLIAAKKQHAQSIRSAIVVRFWTASAVMALHFALFLVSTIEVALASPVEKLA